MKKIDYIFILCIMGYFFMTILQKEIIFIVFLFYYLNSFLNEIKLNKSFMFMLLSFNSIPNLFEINYIASKKIDDNINMQKLLCPMMQNNCLSYSHIANKIYNAYIIIGSSKRNYSENSYNIDFYGNIHYSDAKNLIIKNREIYLDNKVWSDISIKNKTIYLPLSKEDIIMYNYSWLKNYALSELKNNSNKCIYLMMGTQNKWSSYRKVLIKELESNNSYQCIKSINDMNGLLEDYNVSSSELLKRLKDIKCYQI